jgi:hypothetical protein
MANLRAYYVFHLNLAFSSIEEETRGTVIEKCYWPLLKISEKLGLPFGIELTGYTLQEIERLDPSWVKAFRDGIAAGRLELLGSGYTQMIGPLVPARVTQENLKRGNVVYRELLGVQPTTALVNEQAYASGLVELYLEAGYTALVMDWNACATRHPEWNDDWRFGPQRAKGPKGDIDLIWTNTIAFQKVQRYAHGDMSLEEYLDYVETLIGDTPRTFPLYGNDIEIFDFRPGRFGTETTLSASREWDRLETMFDIVKSNEHIELVLPRDTVATRHHTAIHALRLETAALPTPVKKQHKYNITRWAVSGRDDLNANTACWQIYTNLLRAGDAAEDCDWQELCYLWSSDFRTHITEARWKGFSSRLQALLKKTDRPVQSRKPGKISCEAPVVEQDGHYLTVQTASMHVRFNKRRGLAIDRLALASDPQSPLCGTLPHGFFDDIGYGVDWFSGNCTFEGPGISKIADLNPVDPVISFGKNGQMRLEASVVTPSGPIVKSLTLHGDTPRLDYDILFDWQTWERGSLRLGNFTLMPDAFDLDQLSFSSHNGGIEAEEFMLMGEDIDHGAPISFLVSAGSGLGLTEGCLEIGDTKRRLRIDVDMTTAALLGMVTHKPVGNSLFARVCLSALEMDETRNPLDKDTGPRRFRFSLSVV